MAKEAHRFMARDLFLAGPRQAEYVNLSRALAGSLKCYL